MDRCEKCSELRINFDIHGPKQLGKAIRIIRANLEDNTVRDITQSARSTSEKFSDLEVEGPWPDYIEHYFACNSCKSRFRLAVDIYHGSGGIWEGEIQCY